MCDNVCDNLNDMNKLKEEINLLKMEIKNLKNEFKLYTKQTIFVPSDRCMIPISDVRVLEIDYDYENKRYGFFTGKMNKFCFSVMDKSEFPNCVSLLGQLTGLKEVLCHNWSEEDYGYREIYRHLKELYPELTIYRTLDELIEGCSPFAPRHKRVEITDVEVNKYYKCFGF